MLLFLFYFYAVLCVEYDDITTQIFDIYTYICSSQNASITRKLKQKIKQTSLYNEATTKKVRNTLL